MVKILVISDSHGQKDYIDALTNIPSYDYIFHLGDGVDRDLGTNIYNPNFKYVKGNCDEYYSDIPLTETIFLENIKIFLTHGFEYKVRHGMEILRKVAKDGNYNIVFYGHTHIQKFEVVDNVYYINPGALKNGNYSEVTLNKNEIIINNKNIKDL